MNLSRYLEICKEIEDAEYITENKKRQSYTAGNDDVLHNFNDDAEFVGSSPLQNVLTHLMKQIRAISSYVKNPDIEPSETLLSRVVDVRVYSKLLVAVATEMGRTTGLANDYIKIKDLLDNPMFTHEIGGQCCDHFREPDPPTTIVDPARVMYLEEGLLDQESWKKFLGRPVYDYTFGKDSAEEPWKD